MAKGRWKVDGVERLKQKKQRRDSRKKIMVPKKKKREREEKKKIVELNTRRRTGKSTGNEQTKRDKGRQADGEENNKA